LRNHIHTDNLPNQNAHQTFWRKLSVFRSSHTFSFFAPFCPSALVSSEYRTLKNEIVINTVGAIISVQSAKPSLSYAVNQPFEHLRSFLPG
jgi:hypothetical protein